MLDQIEQVRRYYKSTDFDFEHYWSGRNAQALHFGYFDETTRKHEASLLRMNQVLADLVNVTENDRVLDAGCGYGGTSVWLAENVGCSVTGVTVVAYHVQQAQRRAVKSSASALLNFAELDYGNTGLADGSFSVVWGLESVVHCADRQRYAQEAYRLLKPGGRILISEYMLSDGYNLTADEQWRLRRWLDGWAMPELLTAGSYRDLLQDAGFGSIEFQDFSQNVEPSLRRCRRNALIARPFVRPFRKLGLIDDFRVQFTHANIDLYDLFMSGAWRYRVVTALKPT